MRRSMLFSLLLLPINVTVVVPLLIYYFSDSDSRMGLFDSNYVQQMMGFILFAIGILVSFYSFSLFDIVGKATLAPWHPPKKLIVRGPYRFLRNPMLASVLLILFSEALLFNSNGIMYWAILFFLLNNAYVPLVEEKKLVKRFGQEYLDYKANVPMWFPRLTPWRPPSDKAKDEAQTKDNQ